MIKSITSIALILTLADIGDNYKYWKTFIMACPLKVFISYYYSLKRYVYLKSPKSSVLYSTLKCGIFRGFGEFGKLNKS
jgi:hypothetical protein